MDIRILWWAHRKLLTQVLLGVDCLVSAVARLWYSGSEDCYHETSFSDEAVAVMSDIMVTGSQRGVS